MEQLSKTKHSYDALELTVDKEIVRQLSASKQNLRGRMNNSFLPGDVLRDTENLTYRYV